MAPLNKLTTAFLKTAKAGKHLDGGGLYFRKRKSGSADWFLRFMLNKERQEMGFGGYPQLSLKDARDLRAANQALARQGLDPRQERNRKVRENSKTTYTLQQYVEKAYSETIKYGLKNNGEGGRWLSPLKSHIFPKIGHIAIEHLTAEDVLKCLRSIWHTKPDPALKALGRISRTLEIADADDKLNVDFGLIRKVKTLLGQQSIEEGKHLASMPYNEIPAFYQTLISNQSQTTLALRLLILTAARVGPLRKMELSEICDKVWTIPKEKMKGRKGKVTNFEIPLSKEALKVIALAKPMSRDGFLCASSKNTSVISDTTLGMHLRRAGVNATAGGFRASIRTWLDDVVDARFEVSEAVMAHKVGNKTTRAYARSDLFITRSKIMDRWAEHVLGAETSQIVKLHNG
jgi:integrase